MLELYAFTLSHFSEKIRWALDFEGLPYTERVLLPGVHIPIVRRRAPKSSVPLLGHDGTYVQGSGAILDYLEERLGASRLAVPEASKARAAALEALADRAFGLGVQRIGYDALLGDKAMVIDLWTQRGPWWGRWLYRPTYPAIEKAIRRTYKIAPETVEEAKDRLRRAMDETDRVLEKQRYLLGDERPTRVDVTVAALLAPLARPPNHVAKWPANLGAKSEEILREIADRPTFRFALRMYADHRAGAQ